MTAGGGRPVLVALRALGLGDLLVAVPALRALGRAFPGHERVLLAPRFLAPLLPLVQDGWSLTHVAAKDAVPDHAPAVTSQPIDVAVNLHGRGPQSHTLLRRLEPRRLLAFAAPAASPAADAAQTPDLTPDLTPGLTPGLAPSWREDEHEVRRWCRMLAAHGVQADPHDLDLPVPRPPGPGHDGATVLHVGAAGPSRRWPLERWALVADAVRRSGRRVVLTGTATERSDALVVARWAHVPEDDVVAGRTSLADLVDVVAGAARVVAADTGVAHLATALRVPSVVLFGPVSPARWGPPPERWWHVPLWAGQQGDPFAAEPDPALLRLGVEDVLAALAGLPDRARVPEALVSP